MSNILTINGNYTQGSTGVLNMNVYGSSMCDHLTVTGLATLDGTLTVSGYAMDCTAPLKLDHKMGFLKA
jgi:hypothetical protein